VHDRRALDSGSKIHGPAIVEQDDSTVLVAPGWRLTIGDAGNAVMERA
jgi:N-methylhydantoinase A